MLISYDGHAPSLEKNCTDNVIIKLLGVVYQNFNTDFSPMMGRYVVTEIKVLV